MNNKISTLGTDHLKPCECCSIFPLCCVYGLVWDPGIPGAGPKCFNASLLLLPLTKKVPVPVGAF